jgi:hypothetical protein
MSPTNSSIPLYRGSGINGCYTSKDSPLFGIGFPDNDEIECSNHGICIETKCVCDKYWSSSNDIIGTVGMDCVRMDILIIIVWSVVLFRWVIIAYRHYQAIKFRVELFDKHLEREIVAIHSSDPSSNSIAIKIRKKGRLARQSFLSCISCGNCAEKSTDNSAMIIGELLLSGLVHTPSIIILSCLTIVGEVIMVDWPVTIIYLISALGIYITRANVQIRATKTALIGVSLKNRENTPNSRTLWSLVVLHMIITSAFFIGGTCVSADTYNGVILRMWIIISRNLFQIINLIYMTAFSISWSRATNTLAAENSQISSRRTKNAIERMKSVTNQSTTNIIMVGVLYVVFSIPYLIPFQTYLFAFVFFVSASRAHTVFLYLDDKDSNDDTESRRLGHESSVVPGVTSAVASTFSGHLSTPQSGIPPNAVVLKRVGVEAEAST